MREKQLNEYPYEKENKVQKTAKVYEQKSNNKSAHTCSKSFPECLFEDHVHKEFRVTIVSNKD